MAKTLLKIPRKKNPYAETTTSVCSARGSFVFVFYLVCSDLNQFDSVLGVYLFHFSWIGTPGVEPGISGFFICFAFILLFIAGTFELAKLGLGGHPNDHLTVRWWQIDL